MVDRESHTNFMLLMLRGLPTAAQSQDVNRLTLAYFLISSLDLLDALQQIEAGRVIDWVYAAQVLPLATEGSLKDMGGCFMGFRGSPSVGTRFSSSGAHPLLHDGGHLASTYSALAILKILGDDLSRVRKDALLSSMRTLQRPDGSFTSMHMGAETDLRFVYCAVAISAMLNDWAGLDTQKAFKYILDCQSYDDGFGLSPGQESHGGATYCATAALLMMGYIILDPISGKLSSSVLDVNALIKWCIQKQSQSGGFQGRLNKCPDACYAFWVAGSLHLLGAGHLCNANALRAFLLSCQDKYGGFSKWPGELPDMLHAYYGLCGLSLLGEPHFKGLCCELGISTRAAMYLMFERK